MRRPLQIRKSQFAVLAMWGLYTAWGIGWGGAYLIATLQRFTPQIQALLLYLGL